MLFPTTIFAVFFLIVFHVHWALAGRPGARKIFLLAASLFFYGFWSWKFALMLLGSALINHAMAVRIAGMPGDAAIARRRWGIYSVVFNLGLLGFFKYADFAVADVFFPILRPICVALGSEAVDWLIRAQESVYPWLSRIVLPVGISFFTFQAMSYVLDVYRRDTEPTRSWIDFANYLAFFPQLVAGPIVRARDLAPQMEQMPGSEEPLEAGRAVFLILSGLFKKIVVANWLASRLADPVFRAPENFSGPDLLIGIYGYAIQIYCDFSAYSDIAIGAALLLGFRFPINFNAPYFGTTLQDFWRRWHISLSSWLRDYLYIPLGGSRSTAVRTYVNLFITFLLGGLWHGAAWTFVFWGAFHGAYLSLERKYREWLRIPARGAPPARRGVAILGRIWIFHVVCFSWILFRSGTVETTTAMLRGLAAWRSEIPEVTLWSGLSIGVILVGFATQFFDGNRLVRIWNRMATWPAWAVGAGAAIVLTLILALGPEGVAPFIYFQF
ncbi:MAG: MBOAT family protein [Kiritimatiellae bacterium]|nr:MBOAT family protein [Kiritimatiellia bacterium]